jgi:hypothetical protein
MNELSEYIHKYLKQIRPKKEFKLIFDPELESESDFWAEYKSFSVPEPCGTEGSFNRVGAILKDNVIHFGLNPISPVGAQLKQCIETINGLQLPY